MFPPWLLIVDDVAMLMFPPLEAVPATLSESAQKMIGPLLVWIVPAVVAEVEMF
jgi:hypothetical protein